MKRFIEGTDRGQSTLFLQDTRPTLTRDREAT